MQSMGTHHGSVGGRNLAETTSSLRLVLDPPQLLMVPLAALSSGGVLARFTGIGKSSHMTNDQL